MLIAIWPLLIAVAGVGLFWTVSTLATKTVKIGRADHSLELRS